MTEFFRFSGKTKDLIISSHANVALTVLVPTSIKITAAKPEIFYFCSSDIHLCQMLCPKLPTTQLNR